MYAERLHANTHAHWERLQWLPFIWRLTMVRRVRASDDITREFHIRAWHPWFVNRAKAEQRLRHEVHSMECQWLIDTVYANAPRMTKQSAARGLTERVMRSMQDSGLRTIGEKNAQYFRSSDDTATRGSDE